jgi:2-desacetyl-2-hydroxyethyl bacteriochlorophyllide A dehydrogenase
MKAMVIDRFGGPDTFELREIEMPRPSDDEIVIRTAYAGVNPADWKMREGLVPGIREYVFPLVIGFDAAGVVEEVGAAVTRFKPGDRVTTLTDNLIGTHGSYAEKVRTRVNRVQHLPDNVSFREGATIPVGGATAYGAVVDLGKAAKGDKVFVNGGAGSVGLFAIQMAKNAGASVATTCSQRNDELVRDYGADLVIDYNSQDIAGELAKWAPEGVDLIVDAIGLSSLPADAARSVRKGGKIVSIYTAIKDVEGFDADVAKERGVELIPNLVAFERQDDHFRGTIDGFEKGVLRAPPIVDMALSDVAEAHRLSEQGHVRGKIVLKIADL